MLARRGLEVVTLVPDARERSQQEMSLQTTLGPALMSTIGYGATEVEAAYTREPLAERGESGIAAKSRHLRFDEKPSHTVRLADRRSLQRFQGALGITEGG